MIGHAERWHLRHGSGPYLQGPHFETVIEPDLQLLGWTHIGVAAVLPVCSSAAPLTVWTRLAPVAALMAGTSVVDLALQARAVTVLAT